MIQNVTVGDDDINGLDLVAKRGAQIQRTHRVRRCADTRDRDALRNVTVQPRAVPGTNAFHRAGATGAGRPTATGRFSTAEFVPGPYVLEALNLPRGWIVKSVMVGTQDAADVPVELPEADSTMSSSRSPTRCRGWSESCVAATTKGTGNATVGVFPVDRTIWRRVGMQSRRTRDLHSAPRRSVPDHRPSARRVLHCRHRGRGAGFFGSRRADVADSVGFKITLAAGEQKSTELRSVIRK